MSYTHVVDLCTDLSFLKGKVVGAYHVEYGTVALRLDKDNIVYFGTDEVTVGHWFEIFPLKLLDPPQYEFSWSELETPFVITGIVQLWREEWTVPVEDDGGFLGSGPHFAQFAKPLGSAPNSSSQVVKVHAGVKLQGNDGGRIVICSSNDSPFKIDFAVREVDVERIFSGHSCQ